MPVCRLRAPNGLVRASAEATGSATAPTARPATSMRQRDNGNGPFFRPPTGLAVGLARKESRYAAVSRRFAPGPCGPLGPPFPGTAVDRHRGFSVMYLQRRGTLAERARVRAVALRVYDRSAQVAARVEQVPAVAVVLERRRGQPPVELAAAVGAAAHVEDHAAPGRDDGGAGEGEVAQRRVAEAPAAQGYRRAGRVEDARPLAVDVGSVVAVGVPLDPHGQPRGGRRADATAGRVPQPQLGGAGLLGQRAVVVGPGVLDVVGQP